jgi:hypothetical protein
MCGIIFALRQSTRNNPNPDILANLIIANESRGRQATGMWGNGMYKDTISASKMLETKSQAGMSRRALLAKISKHPVFIAHTRQGTTGANTKPNAHPFRYKNTVGCHNGVLSNHFEIATKYNLPTPVVDSQVIFSALVDSDYNMDRVSEIHGSIAFVMNREETRIKRKYVRNEDGTGSMQDVEIPSNITYVYRRDNPLYVSKRKGILYGSSMPEPFKDMGMQCMSLDANTLYVFVDGRLMEKRSIAYDMPARKLNNYGWFEDEGYQRGSTSYYPKTKVVPLPGVETAHSAESDFEKAVAILITQAMLAVNEVALDLPIMMGYDEDAVAPYKYCILNGVNIASRHNSPQDAITSLLTYACSKPDIKSCNPKHKIDLSYKEAILWLITYAILQLNGADASYPTTIAGKRVANALESYSLIIPLRSYISIALKEFDEDVDFSQALVNTKALGLKEFHTSLDAVQALQIV